MSGLRNFIHSTYKSAAERVLPTLSQSQFKEKGVSFGREDSLITRSEHLANWPSFLHDPNLARVSPGRSSRQRSL